MKANLIIDEGNTYSKCAWFEGEKLKQIKRLKSEEVFNEAFLSQEGIKALMISSVKRNKAIFQKAFQHIPTPFFFLDHESKLPLRMDYETPQTLGNDRIAGVVAANDLFPAQNVLVIDAGTCITYDFVSSENAFKGGGIAAGLYMRFKALNNYTANLPLIEEFPNETPLIGKSTKESMLSGVINGLKTEVEGMIQLYLKQFPDLKVLLTGGDAKLFESNLKSNIFAHPNLVIQGLNKILRYNASYQ